MSIQRLATAFVLKKGLAGLASPGQAAVEPGAVDLLIRGGMVFTGSLAVAATLNDPATRGSCVQVSGRKSEYFGSIPPRRLAKIGLAEWLFVKQIGIIEFPQPFVISSDPVLIR